MERILNFRMSGRLLLGIGAIELLQGVVREVGKPKAVVVTDAGVVAAGICNRVCSLLRSGGVSFEIFDKVEPDPRIEIVSACLEAARAAEAGVLIGVGGGSSMDIAKVVAVLMTNQDDVSQYIGINRIPKPGIPTILIPTTAGTGSEVTPIAVLSDKADHLKKGIVSEHLYASVALVDPELTVGLPPHVTAFTGMDALAHVMEAYTNKFAQPFVDTFALEGIRLIGTHIRRAVAVGDDLQARYAMSLGSLYGGMCLGSVNTAAAHALAYPLGGTFDVPHGVATSLLLPHVVEFNLPNCTEKYAHIATALGKQTAGLTAERAARLAVEGLVEVVRDIGIVSRMRDLNIPEDAIPGMADAAMKVTRLLDNNPRVLQRDDAEAIYRNAY
jgi:alcohol dehydrogenase class IV